ncbi:hypothetical protein VTK56DRAFT_6951 [Thermocarpiscus australiensis]
MFRHPTRLSTHHLKAYTAGIAPERIQKFTMRLRPIIVVLSIATLAATQRQYELPPPWEGPEHCIEEYCLFANPDVGDGTVLIATPGNAYLTANYLAVPHTVVEPTASYEAEVPGKGTGLIANRTIRKGEIMLQRMPAVLIQSSPHLRPGPGNTREAMGTTLWDKPEKIAYSIWVDGTHRESGRLGLFPEPTLPHHEPHPHHHRRPGHPPPPAEELTVSYIYGQADRSERQRQLSAWGFRCARAQCTLPALEAAASDARIRQIKQLEGEIESRMMAARGGGGGGAEEVRPEMGAKLVELYLAERLDAAPRADVHAGRAAVLHVWERGRGAGVCGRGGARVGEGVWRACEGFEQGWQQRNQSNALPRFDLI